VFSGVTVALGLVALIAQPVAFVRGIGIGGMLIPLISCAATLTIVPALLAGGARRLDWPHLRHEAAPARGWTAWARLAALILFLAMAALASAPFTFLKIFATGVGAGILLDATVVRSLLVPALVSLFGEWNWWLPGRAARILRTSTSPLPGRRSGQAATGPAMPEGLHPS
jgi:uncharacterized membrane protein YdfJ with MMPL/SSD domain